MVRGTCHWLSWPSFSRFEISIAKWSRKLNSATTGSSERTMFYPSTFRKKPFSISRNAFEMDVWYNALMEDENVYSPSFPASLYSGASLVVSRGAQGGHL